MNPFVPLGVGQTSVDIEITLYILNKLTAISAVDKSFPYRSSSIGNLLTYWRCDPRIMYYGAADVYAEDEYVSVNSNIVFYAFYLLIGIDSVVAMMVAPLYTLGVKRHDQGCGGLLTLTAYFHDEFFYTMIQIVFRPPFVKIPIHGLPFGEVMGKHTPLAAADQKIQDCLEYGSQGIFAVSVIIFKEYFVYISPSFKLLRLTRLLKMVRLLKVFRYSDKITTFLRVLKKERQVLFLVLMLALFYIFITALVMFNAEPHINPNTGAETFHSILMLSIGQLLLSLRLVTGTYVRLLI